VPAAHAYVRVVIAPGPTQLSFSFDGTSAKTSWARGDVPFVGRGVAREARNTGGKPVDMPVRVFSRS
jgi:hypothetical protein